MNNTIDKLLNIMKQLRNPEGGCAWDLEQTFETIAPYTIEEAYEVEEAIHRGDMNELKEELGDLLLQVVFHAQMASEANHFTFEDVVHTVSQKMINRHPHVFGTAEDRDSAGQTTAWEAQKQKEREQKAKPGDQVSALDGVASALPALMRAQKLQKRAARVGFDWPNTIHVLDKIKEESSELYDAFSNKESQERLHEEYGDLLFVMVNLGRHLKIDCETALRDANHKFTRRFQGVEELLMTMGKSPQQSSLEEMDQLWDRVKSQEKSY